MRNNTNPSLKAIQNEYSTYARSAHKIFREWNQRIRSNLTKNMGVSLTSGDKRKQISVKIMESKDQTIFDIINSKYPTLDFEEHYILTQYLSAAKNSEKYFSSDTRHHLAITIEEADAVIAQSDIEMITQDIFRFLEPNNKDVWGCYFLKDSHIEIYLFPIVLFCQLHGLKLEPFIVMILTHELAHAYNHIGRDKDGKVWGGFHKVDNFIAEGLAQYYTYAFLSNQDYKHNGFIETFNKTLKFQPKEYTWFEGWNCSMEQIYRTFIETRRRRVFNKDHFKIILEESKKAIS